MKLHSKFDRDSELRLEVVSRVYAETKLKFVEIEHFQVLLVRSVLRSIFSGPSS